MGFFKSTGPKHSMSTFCRARKTSHIAIDIVISPHHRKQNKTPVITMYCTFAVINFITQSFIHITLIHHHQSVITIFFLLYNIFIIFGFVVFIHFGISMQTCIRRYLAIIYNSTIESYNYMLCDWLSGWLAGYIG